MKRSAGQVGPSRRPDQVSRRRQAGKRPAWAARPGGQDQSREERRSQRALLPGRRAPRSSQALLWAFPAASAEPRGRQGTGKLPSQGAVPTETFQVAHDSVLGPVNQEHHGGQVGPSRVSAQVNSPGWGRAVPGLYSVSPKPQASTKESGFVLCSTGRKGGWAGSKGLNAGSLPPFLQHRWTRDALP